MVDRQEVEALLEVVRGGTEHVCARLGVAPGHTVYAVEVDTLAALCRAWLALDAPKVRVRGKVGEVCMVPVSHDFCGQRVRIVREVG